MVTSTQTVLRHPERSEGSSERTGFFAATKPLAAQNDKPIDGYQNIPSGGAPFWASAISRIPLTLFAAAPKNDVPAEYRWNMADIYSTEADWERSLNATAKEVKELAALQATIALSGREMFNALEKIYSAAKEVAKLYSYSKLSLDLDMNNSHSKALFERADKLKNDLVAATSFLEPTVLAIPDEKLAEFKTEEPRLATIYGHMLDNVLRMRAHTLSLQEEKIVADLQSMGDAGYKVFDIYNTAVMPHSTVKLADGKEVELTDSAYTNYRALPNRDDRRLVFERFWSDYARDQKLYAETLNQAVQANVRMAKVRKYNSAIEAELFGENLDPKVYDAMLKGVHDGLPALWRYLGLRKKILKLDKLEYIDLYTSIIPGAEMKFTIPEGEKAILEALAPLGNEAVAAVKHGFENRWTDFMPSKGKASGAYMEGAVVDVHPFVLLNFEGNYDSVSTIAHEFGHALHSWFTNKTQPYVYTDYPTFIAEVASTVNELLLERYAIDHAPDKETKLALLGQQLDNIRQTIFRQAMFAEFEKAIYDKVWNGEPLTDEVLNAAYLDLLKQYYGHEKGVTSIDDRYSVEWAYIQHFYYNFYVYNYTTSLTAAVSIAKKILSGDKEATKAYLEMLKKGGSEYPVELLKGAGVDMTTTRPYEAVVEQMNNIMDEIEASF